MYLGSNHQQDAQFSELRWKGAEHGRRFQANNNQNATIKKGEIMANTVHDPVCGMDIDPATAAGKSEYNGQTYYFCSLGCKKSFDEKPEKYLDKKEI